ncbi:MAG TPA: acyl carrier protein [Gammaproteobacteria bacterium]|nr:acyl carrier protein [Gammaproteobacteria bacterium]
MAQQSEQERELAAVLVSALDLDDVDPADIDPQAPLFGVDAPDSLGLDSIDALEIALAVAQNYGVQLKADDENNRAIFASLRALSEHIAANR